MFVVGGESLVDLVSQPCIAGGEYVMHAYAGGSPYNCAIALSKLGNSTGFLCPISKDGFGDFLMAPLQGAGVGALLGERVFTPTTLAVVTLNEKGQAQYEFYRGADRALDADALIAALPDRIEVYQSGGFCPIEPDDAEIWLRVIAEAKRRGAIISIDPNIRPSLVDDFDAYKQRLDRFLDLANVVKVSVEDLEALNPDQSIVTQAEAMLERPACKLVVVTDGEHGSKAFTQSARAEASIYSPPVFGDTVGAGDSLMAGILTWLHDQNRLGDPEALSAQELGAMLRFGAVVSGLNCGQKGCNPPSRAEVDAVLAG